MCLALDKIKKAKAYDEETRVLKKSIKTRGDYNKEAQTAFNLYVRLRDAKENCISCGRDHDGRYDAGHFQTVGAFPELRYHLWNVNKQCHFNCNIKRSGNLIEYRKGLIKKLGIERVEWLEGQHDAIKYSISDLVRIKKIFTLKAKRLKARLDD